MGVTTAVGGNCGLNVCDPVTYLDTVDAEGAPVNMAMLAGHAFLRERTGAADKYAPISKDQLEILCCDTEAALEGGCLGVSYGIRYVPGITKEELDGTAKLCKKENKLIAAHLRDDAEAIFDAADELISVGLKYDLNTEVSHIGSMAGFGQMERFLRRMDNYRANGLHLHCDCYPYYAFSTYLGTTTYDDGFLDRYHTDYSVVEICEGKYKGQRCTKEIFDELRRDAPMTLTVCHVMRPEDVDMALLHPGVMLASDGILNSGQGHPRAAGAFPRFLNEYVNGGKLPLYDAVEKMTSMPAAKLGLAKKGGLSVGDDADITIFDLHNIKDTATFSSPITPPLGITDVLINGRQAIADGRVISNHFGKSVRK
ncbi:MAG: amidohydrolase family protein, partial [Synergistaceae bacterium]|nr:amidohydrolase family protein [Synergistaceae bacterium]